MIHISDTTLCCVACVNHEASIRALRKTLATTSFERAIFLTDADVNVDDVEVIRVAPLRSSPEYSQFMLHRLLEHVTTKFVLIVQWDGYVIDSNAWREEFKQYDYIGARWDWAPPNEQVGNGGFSLRSRKLLNALRDPRTQSTKSEDVAICREFRSWLMSDYGIRFADSSIADQFSYERTRPNAPTFGFHGAFNMSSLIAETELENFLAALSDSVFNGPEILELGLNYWRDEKLLSAQLVFEQIAQRKPDRIDAKFLRDQVVVLAQSSRTDFVKTNDVLRMAMQYHQEGDVATAGQLYLLAIVLDPNHADALNLAGLLSVQIGQAAHALPLLKKAIAIRGDVADFHADLASGLNSLGRGYEAIASYLDAIRLNPNNAAYFFELGAIYQTARDVVRAKDCFNRALQLKPDWDEVKNALANLST